MAIRWDKFTVKAQEAVQRANDLASEHGNPELSHLASSAKAEEVEYYKKLAGIDDLIHGETSSDDVEESKPAPDIFSAALQRLGNPNPRETIAVGDTPYDAQAAGKIGLRTVGVLCGGFQENDLRAAGCFAIYKDPCDLLAHCAESPLAERRKVGVPRNSGNL